MLVGEAAQFSSFGLMLVILLHPSHVSESTPLFLGKFLPFLFPPVVELLENISNGAFCHFPSVGDNML